MADLMSLILGIDPGSRVTGYGLVAVEGRQLVYVDSGCIRTEGAAMPERLGLIYAGIEELLSQHRPQWAAVEQVFMARNPDSALKLGQARGAAICAIVRAGVGVSEYGARQIKLAVVGYGNAAKTQIQEMVSRLLQLPRAPQADAADALAAAICHIHHAATATRQAASVALSDQVTRR